MRGSTYLQGGIWKCVWSFELWLGWGWGRSQRGWLLFKSINFSDIEEKGDRVHSQWLAITDKPIICGITGLLRSSPWWIDDNTALAVLQGYTQQNTWEFCRSANLISRKWDWCVHAKHAVPTQNSTLWWSLHSTYTSSVWNGFGNYMTHLVLPLLSLWN